MRCTDYSKVASALDAKLDADTRRYLDGGRDDDDTAERYDGEQRIEVSYPVTCDGCGASPELGMVETYYVRNDRVLCGMCEEAVLADREG